MKRIKECIINKWDNEWIKYGNKVEMIKIWWFMKEEVR